MSTSDIVYHTLTFQMKSGNISEIDLYSVQPDLPNWVKTFLSNFGQFIDHLETYYISFEHIGKVI